MWTIVEGHPVASREYRSAAMGNCMDSMRFYFLNPTDISIYDLSQRHQGLTSQRQQLEDSIRSSGVRTTWDEARLQDIDMQLRITQMALDKCVTKQAERNTDVLARTTRRIQDSSAGVQLTEDAAEVGRVASEISAARRLVTARLSSIVKSTDARTGYSALENIAESTEARHEEYEEEEEDDGLGGSKRLVIPVQSL